MKRSSLCTAMITLTRGGLVTRQSCLLGSGARRAAASRQVDRSPERGQELVRTLAGGVAPCPLKRAGAQARILLLAHAADALEQLLGVRVADAVGGVQPEGRCARGLAVQVAKAGNAAVRRDLVVPQRLPASPLGRHTET